jgi:hypothetical protein
MVGMAYEYEETAWPRDGNERRNYGDVRSDAGNGCASE